MKHICSFLVIAVLALCAVSCSDDKREIAFFSGDEPIYQIGTCDNLVSSVKLYTIKPDGVIIGIDGGDGNYAVVGNSNEAVVTATMTTPDKYKRILLVPTDVGKMGEAVITISDGDGKTAVLRVTVGEYGIKMLIKEQGILVDGDISDAMRNEITETMKNTFPIKIEGGFVMLSDTYGEIKEGKLRVYPQNFDEAPLEGSYTWKEPVNGKKSGLTLKYGGKVYQYVLSIRDVPEVRSNAGGLVPLYEDVTSEYLLECPMGMTIYRVSGMYVVNL